MSGTASSLDGHVWWIIPWCSIYVLYPCTSIANLLTTLQTGHFRIFHCYRYGCGAQPLKPFVLCFDVVLFVWMQIRGVRTKETEHGSSSFPSWLVKHDARTCVINSQQLCTAANHLNQIQGVLWKRSPYSSNKEVSVATAKIAWCEYEASSLQLHQAVFIP